MFASARFITITPRLLTQARWCLTAGGAVAIVVGLSGQLIRPSQAATPQICPVVASPSSEISSQLMVDISGAVQKPGVYALESGSRIGEVVELAGGFTKLADRQFVAKELNLSKSVTDGAKIYIPFVHESQTSDSVFDQATNPAGAANSTTQSSMAGLISLNSATQAQLDELEGIGAKRAADIIAGRPYSKIEDLVIRNIISQTVFDGLKNKLSL